MPINQSTYAAPRDDLAEAFREYNPDGQTFIGEEILPVRDVVNEAATLSVITRENTKVADNKHANGAAFNRVDMIAEDLSYTCVDRGLEIALTDKDRAKYVNDFDAELEAIQILKTKMMMKKEERIKDLIFNTTTFTGSTLYNDYSGTPWDTTTTDIVLQINYAKEKVRTNSTYKADTLIIGEGAMQNLLINDDIRARFPGAPIITEAMIRAQLAAIFGLTNLIVGSAVYDGAKEGQDFSGTDIWADDYAMVCKRQQGSTRSGGLGRSINWSALSSGIDAIVEYREEQTEADIFRSREYVVEKIFDANFGHLLKID
mgnify:CR=1 FL=1